MSQAGKKRVGRSRAGGFTILELMVAMLVLTIGIVGVAQLYAVATLNSTLSVNTSTGLIDAQRCLEAMRGIARSSSLGINDPRLVSSTYSATLGSCPTYVTVTGYDSENFKESVWVYNSTGRVDGNGIDPPGSTARGPLYAVAPALPPGYGSAPLAPSTTTLIVVVRLEPVSGSRRLNQPVTLTTVISHDY
jgi:Tfp pilus assembly protein PilV